jgi:hypothetical protein
MHGRRRAVAVGWAVGRVSCGGGAGLRSQAGWGWGWGWTRTARRRAFYFEQTADSEQVHTTEQIKRSGSRKRYKGCVAHEQSESESRESNHAATRPESARARGTGARLHGGRHRHPPLQPESGPLPAILHMS